MASLANDPIYTSFGTDGEARRGEVTTPHGKFQTPAFMPVGTTGTMKALSFEDMTEMGTEIILGNTYHLYLRPGAPLIEQFGGLAKFNSWNGPMLTDSGGYQVFSLRDISKISDEGVKFQSHIDGSYHMFTPENVMETQHAIGADIIMAFDQCVPYPADEKLASEGVRRTHEWAIRCRDRHAELCKEREFNPFLFGIVQGSTYKELRAQSAQQIVELDFPGNAVGGVSVGETKEEMEDMLAFAIGFLPGAKPRYMMGIGYPDDILMAVSHGVDMFDCILPTRSARTGLVFTSEGPLVYRNAKYAKDDRPLDPNCDCRVCRKYSRAYLRHLYNMSEITGFMLASYHSSYFFQELMRGIRKSIEEKRFSEFKKEFLAKYQSGSK